MDLSPYALPAGGILVLLLIIWFWRSNAKRRAFLDDLPRRAREREVQQRRRNYPAAVALGEFAKDCEDLGIAIARQNAKVGRAADDITPSKFVSLSVIGITRSIALHRDCIRPEDGDRLLTYVDVTEPHRLDQPTQAEATSMIQEIMVDEEQMVMGLQLLDSIDSPESGRLRDLLIGFAKEVGASPAESVSRRSSAVDSTIAALHHPARVRSDASDDSSPVDVSELYEIFEIDEDCSDEELRAAYHEKVKSWHPDRLHGASESVLAHANAQVTLFNVTYDTLTIVREAAQPL